MTQPQESSDLPAVGFRPSVIEQISTATDEHGKNEHSPHEAEYAQEDIPWSDIAHHATNGLSLNEAD